jgi:RHS repeat-associated protein
LFDLGGDVPLPPMPNGGFGPEPITKFPSPGNQSKGGATNTASNNVPINAQNGNYNHGTRDLEYKASVGFLGLSFGRMASSRYTTSVRSDLGGGGSWRHNWQFSAYRNFMSDGREQLEVHFPDGAWGNYVKPQSNPNAPYMYELGLHRSDRVEIDPNDAKKYRLYLEDGTSLVIQRYGSYEANTEFLSVTQVLDRHGLGYTLSYNAQQQLVRVTDPAGRLLQMTYTNVGVNDGDIAQASFSISESQLQALANYSGWSYPPQSVAVAGEFNGWDFNANPMVFDEDTQSWKLDIPLQAGSYGYTFSINGDTWIGVIDGSVPTSSTNINVTAPNPVLSDYAREVTFEYKGSASSCVLMSSFNNWQGQAMTWNAAAQAWRINVTLNPGEYYYKFLVNGTSWIVDPTNPFTQKDPQNNTNSVLSVGNVVKKLTKVQAFYSGSATAQETVSYQYEVFNAGPVYFATLTGVTYPNRPDATASFTYAQPQFWAGRPRLSTLHDPRHHDKKHDRIGFEYHDAFNTGAPLEGFIKNVYHLDTGEIFAEIDHAESASGLVEEMKITYSNGKEEYVKLNGSMLPSHRKSNITGAPVDQTVRFHGGAGMIQKSIDATGRVTEITRTNEFGRPLTIRYPDGKLVTYTYTNPLKPFFISLRKVTYDKEGTLVDLDTIYIRNAQNRVSRINHPDLTYETFSYNARGQVTSHRQRDGVTLVYGYTSQGMLTSYTKGGQNQHIFSIIAQSGKLASVILPGVSGQQLRVVPEYDFGHRITRLNYYSTAAPNTLIVYTLQNYNARGILTSRRDSRAQVWNYYPDFYGRTIQETDPSGRFTNYIFNDGGGSNGCGCGSGFGGPAAVVTPDGNTVSYHYDLAGRVLHTKRGPNTADEMVTSTEYDVLGRVAKRIDPTGLETTYVYEPFSGLLWTEHVGGNLNDTTSYEYDGFGNPLKVIKDDGSYARNFYDNNGRLTETQICTANQTIVRKSKRSYNANGQVNTTTDGKNNVTSYSYNSVGLPHVVTKPGGITQAFVYDASSRLISETNTPITTTYGHDLFGQVVSHTHEGVTTLSTYEPGPDGLLLTQTVTKLGDGSPGAAHVTYYAYDAAGRKTITVQHEVLTIWQHFTPDSRSTTVLNGSRSTVSTIDLAGRIKQTKDGLGRATNYAYAFTANHTLTTTVTNPLNKTTATVTDGLGRVITSRDENNDLTAYFYDCHDNLVKYTDARAHSVTFEFDAAGQRKKRTEHDGTWQSYEYDLAGNMTQHRKADGSIATITYNNRNQPDYKSWSNSSEFIDWNYDASGRLDYVENQQIKTSFMYYTYDAYNAYGSGSYSGLPSTLVEKEITRHKNFNAGLTRLVDRDYDPYMRLTGLTVQQAYTNAILHKLNYSYQALGQPRPGLLAAINNDGPPPLASYQYDSSGLVQSIALENNLTTHWTRDAAYQTTAYQTKTSAGLNRAGVEHGYDSNGRRKWAKYEDNLGQAYAYDDAGQVTHAKVNVANPHTATATSSPTHHYQYDDVGNRTSVLDLGVTKSYGANSVNAYTSISGFAAPVHDANGNMTSGPVNGSAVSSMVYGQENNNLLAASGAQATNFVYDAMGRLVQFSYTENSINKTEILTWAGWTLMTREIFTGNAVSESHRYTWGTDLSGTMEGAGGVGGLLAIERNVAGSNSWDIRYTHADANGNIIALTNSSGAVSARYRYDAFGKVLNATDVDNSGWVNHNIHGFSSKPSFGNQGLLYYGYRWYSPSLGRWINRDPIEEKGGMNLYGFVGNDGVNWVDLFGLSGSDYLACRDEMVLTGYWPTSDGDHIPVDDNTRYFPYPEEYAFGGGLESQLHNVIYNKTVVDSQVPRQFTLPIYYQRKDAASQFIIYVNYELLGYLAGSGVGKAVGSGFKAWWNTSAKTPLTKVTSWADEGITPDLIPGRWVQLGDATKTNFWRTGLPGPKVHISLKPPSVSVQGSKVPFTNSITDDIPTSSLQWPPGLDKWRGLFGQRKIKGGGE